MVSRNTDFRRNQPFMVLGGLILVVVIILVGMSLTLNTSSAGGGNQTSFEVNGTPVAQREGLDLAEGSNVTIVAVDNGVSGGDVTYTISTTGTGGEDLATTLGLGNTTSGTDIVVTTADFLAFDDNGSAFNLQLAEADTLTANRTLSLDLGDGDRTFDLGANLTVEALSILNQDLTTDAAVIFAGITSNGNNDFTGFYTDIDQIATPANPGAGTRRLFVDSGTGELSVRTSGGSTVSLEGAGGGGAPTSAQYVVLSTDATLSDERVLTGTTNQITITDNGAGSTVVLSTPQDLDTGADVTFGTITGADAIDAFVVSSVSGEILFTETTNDIRIEALDQTTSDSTAQLPNLAGATDQFVFEDFTQTLTNKTITLGSNTFSGTAAQFDTAVTDDDIVYIGSIQTITGAKTLSASTTFSNATDAIVISDTGGELVFNETTNDINVTSLDQTVGESTAQLPNLAGTTDQFVFEDVTQTLTNKTIDGGSNTINHALSAVLVDGNTTGGNELVITTGDSLSFDDNGSAFDLRIIEGDTLTADRTLTLSLSDTSSTLTIEASSTLNQDLTTDAAVTFAGVTSNGNNDFAGFYTDIDQIATPANPGAGTRRLFVDSGTGEISVRTSGGTTVSLESAGGGSLDVEENDSVVVSSATDLDFGFGFDITESPSGEANITLDYAEDAVDLASGDVTGILDLSDHVNLAAGTGATLTGDTLSVDLGTSIETGEVTDDSLLEVDFDAVDTPSDEECFTYESGAGGDFEWQACGGSGTLTTLKEGGVQLGGADIVTLDFGAGFDLTESPDTEVNVVLDLTEDQVVLTTEVTGTLPAGNGGTGQTAATADGVLVANGSAFVLRVVPDCDGSNEALNYDITTDAFTCATISGGGTLTTVEEGDVQVGGADIVTLDFGSGFDITESPDTEINIVLDYTEDPIVLTAGSTEITGILGAGNGGTGLSLVPSDDVVILGNGTAYEQKALTDCDGAGVGMSYDTATNVFGCNDVIEDITAGTNITRTGDTLDVDDAFVLNTGDTGTGAYDFGGATNFEIPNGTSETPNAAGEIAIDTTDDQLKYYGAAERVITYKWTKSIVIESPADADNFLIFKAEDSLTITDIRCIVDPADTGESVVIDIQERNSTGDSPATVDATITCDNDGAEDDGTLSNGTIDALDWTSIDIGTVTGTVTQLIVTITGTTDAE